MPVSTEPARSTVFGLPQLFKVMLTPITKPHESDRSSTRSRQIIHHPHTPQLVGIHTGGFYKSDLANYRRFSSIRPDF